MRKSLIAVLSLVFALGFMSCDGGGGSGGSGNGNGPPSILPGPGPGAGVIATAYRELWECRCCGEDNIFLTENSIFIGTSATGIAAIAGVSTMTAHGMTQLMHGGSSIGTIQPGDFNITGSAPADSNLRNTEWVRP